MHFLEKIIVAVISVSLVSCGAGDGEQSAVQHTPKSVAQETLGASLAQAGQEKTVHVESPDGKIVFTLEEKQGAFSYRVSFADKTVIDHSKLGLRFLERAPLDNTLKITHVTRAVADTVWEQPWGERQFIRDYHNEIVVHATQTHTNFQFKIRVRNFNDGLGFRYEFPVQQGFGSEQDGVGAIVDELTEFNVGPSAQSWWIPSRMYNRYEYLYRNTPVKNIQLAHTPLTLRNKHGIHVSLHEAALVDYAGMSLRQTREGILEAELAARSDGTKVKFDTAMIQRNGGFKTPWRTIQISTDAAGLVNSNLILNLNEPNKLGDVSWFTPGKYAGIWWDMHIRNKSWGRKENGEPSPHGATTAHAKKYIDFASENGFVGVLIEGWNLGWDNNWYNNGDVFSFTRTYEDFNLEDVAQYALEKGTRLIGHHETSGNITNYENQLEAAFDLYQKNGVRAVKTGYVADDGEIKRVDKNGVARFEYHDSQHQVDHHLNVVRRAAEHQIAINAHEPVKDTGLRRTYPNWVTREGARGQEFNAWGVPPNGPSHVPNLIYTRLLSGPMDYTPGAFNLRPSQLPPVSEAMGRHDLRARIEHTLAKELALYVVLYSPIQMVVDSPEEYAKRPAAFQFIKDVPADWKDTIALAGEVGAFAVIARHDRNSDDWYVGGVTNADPRSYDLNLGFLSKGTYEAQIYRDGPDAHYDTQPYDILIEKNNVTHKDKLKLEMASGGGFAIRFKKL